jgi:nucleoside-diphosphate-sugar epimerase
MRVLVIGATGFIGGHAARACIERGDDVTALARDAERARADVRLRGASILEGRVGAPPRIAPHDVVIYAAGAWRRDDGAADDEIDRRCQEVYGDGVASLATAARSWGAHFVFLSGNSRYGTTTVRAITEDTPPGELTRFGAYKRKAEVTLAATSGLRWTAIVAPEVYGSHDRGGYVHFVYRRMRSRRFVLLGRGDNRWSLCHVANLTDAIVALAAGQGHEVLHVADAEPTSHRALAVGIALALGRSPFFPRVPRSVALAAARLNELVPRAGPRLTPHHVRIRTADRILDTSKARHLGIVPRATLASGLAEAVAWWEAHRGIEG